MKWNPTKQNNDTFQLQQCHCKETKYLPLAHEIIISYIGEAKDKNLSVWVWGWFQFFREYLAIPTNNQSNFQKHKLCSDNHKELKKNSEEKRLSFSLIIIIIALISLCPLSLFVCACIYCWKIGYAIKKGFCKRLLKKSLILLSKNTN